MSALPTSTVVLACVAALAGVVLGLGYFHALRRSVGLLAGGQGWLGAAVLTLARVGGAAAAFVFLAQLGAVPLLAGSGGFLVARQLALRIERA